MNGNIHIYIYTIMVMYIAHNIYAFNCNVVKENESIYVSNSAFIYIHNTQYTMRKESYAEYSPYTLYNIL